MRTLNQKEQDKFKEIIDVFTSSRNLLSIDVKAFDELITTINQLLAKTINEKSFERHAFAHVLLNAQDFLKFFRSLNKQTKDAFIDLCFKQLEQFMQEPLTQNENHPPNSTANISEKLEEQYQPSATFSWPNTVIAHQQNGIDKKKRRLEGSASNLPPFKKIKTDHRKMSPIDTVNINPSEIISVSQVNIPPNHAETENIELHKTVLDTEPPAKLEEKKERSTETLELIEPKLKVQERYEQKEKANKKIALDEIPDKNKVNQNNSSFWQKHFPAPTWHSDQTKSASNEFCANTTDGRSVHASAEYIEIKTSHLSDIVSAMRAFKELYPGKTCYMTTDLAPEAVQGMLTSLEEKMSFSASKFSKNQQENEKWEPAEAFQGLCEAIKREQDPMRKKELQNLHDKCCEHAAFFGVEKLDKDSLSSYNRPSP